MEFTFNLLGPFSMTRAAKAANEFLARKQNDWVYPVHFWQEYLFDDEFPKEVAELGGYWPGKLMPKLHEPIKPDIRDEKGFPQYDIQP